MRHRASFVVFFVGLCSLVAATSASALCTINYGPKNKASFEPFVSQPDGLLVSYPNGGEGMTNFVVAFVAREEKGLKTVLEALVKASANQREAIGLALARASEACQASDAGTARAIRAAASRSSDSSFKRGYLAGLPKEEPSAAIGSLGKSMSPGSFSDLPLSGPLDRQGAAGKLADPFAPLL